MNLKKDTSHYWEDFQGHPHFWPTDYKVKASYYPCNSVPVMSNSLQPHGQQHARLPGLLPTPGACSNSCSLNWWCHPTTSSFVALFSCPQSFPASQSFQVSWLFSFWWPKYWSFSFSISPSKDYSGLISFRLSFLSEGLSRVFFNTIVWKALPFR